MLVMLALRASLGVAICRIWVAHLAWALSEASCVEFDNSFLNGIGTQFNFAVLLKSIPEHRIETLHLMLNVDIILNYQSHPLNQKDKKRPLFLMSLVLLLATGFLWHFGRGARNSPQGDRSDSQIQMAKESTTRWRLPLFSDVKRCSYQLWHEQHMHSKTSQTFKPMR